MKMVDVLDPDGRTMPAAANNIFQSNVFIGLSGAPTIRASSNQGGLGRIGSLFRGAGNTFVNLFNPTQMIFGGTNGASANLTFEELAAAGVDASPRRLLPSTLAKWIEAALGTPLLRGTPAEFTAQQTWTSSGTVSLLAGVACSSPSESGACSLFNSSSLGNGQLSSARFPVNAGQFYKVHVQVRSGDAVPWTGTANARRNGPTYENIDVFNLNSPFRIAPSGWAAYDFYFQTVPANSHLLIGNLTVTPATVLPRDANSVTRLFVNRDYAASASASCPAASTCSLWRNLAYGSVSFPFQLPARQAQALWNASAVPPFPAPAAPRGLKSSR